ncbi:uncharacterized protein LOC133800227 [Humulus lupulus]|uniref:uncharacterized protein LOC133800227 n=1 Tax=Humulus lupulus TaxID=3486 RepID=UPI002B407DBE|nr:uncharacterized protein LOC133800227 [Humulus lupulus]
MGSSRIAQVDLDEVQVESLFWSSTVVCQVLGANPPFAIFEGFIKRIWGKLGIERIARLNNGLTLVNFRDELTRDLVLEAGVLHFDRKPAIVKPWSADLDTLKAVKSVPVWVRLPGLGLQYWGTKCLSALMSTIGVPILIDKVTKDKSMMQFARVLVEIEFSEDLPKSVQFLNEKGQLMEQLLEFEWLPTQCRGCKVYGHTKRMCNKKPSEIWRHKTRIGEDEARQVPVAQTFVSEVKETVNTETRPHVSVNGNVDTEAHSVNSKELDKPQESSKKTVPKSSVVNQIRTPGTKTNDGGSLLETKLWGDKIKNMMQSFFRGWSYFSGLVLEGRLLLIWQQNLVSVAVLKETDQLLHACVKGLRTNKKICVTFVYGRNSIDERVALWRDLTNLCFPAAAWLLTGDFNAIFESEDRIVFKNEDWLDFFPQSEAVFNWQLHSDHCYCIIKPEVSVNCGVKIFKFFNMWTNHENCKTTVMQSWCKPIRGSRLVRICKKLSRLQLVLRKFNRHIMGDVAQNYMLAKEKFQAAQISLQSNPHSVNLQRLEAGVGDKLARIYESFLKQKSKVDWLRFGDDNTTYFHACLKQRRASNCITSVVTEFGQSIENFDDVVDHFVTHFQKIMGSKSMASRSNQKSCFDLGHKLTLDQQVSLVKPFSTKEVKEALFSINSIKSLGPDGFGSGFFKVLWRELEAEISAAILDFFECGNLPEEVNKATISLIPKTETHSRAADYRPIACCNSIYKCISKILCSRLASVLPSLVHQNQGAFVKNRLLAHNILILQVIIKGYKWKNISPRCVLKIDLSKAYDMLDWNFLEDILTEFCFLVKFINWVMACLKDPTYLILMNGKVQGEFKGRKGLRQGDLISPLLFVLAIEYCTRLLRQASMDKGFRFHPKCKHLKIVNLCFADDLVIFCKGVNSSVQIIRDSFNEFCCASGLTANKDNSQVYFGGVAEKETQNLLEGLRFTEGNFPLKYLGVPLRTTRWKAGDCSLIIKNIQLKLHTWESRHLSFARRAQLINSVLLSIRSFWMSIFILPKSVTKEVDRLCINFLWGVKDNNIQRSKMHFTAWDQGQDFWHYRASQDVSWYWRRLVKFRDDFPAHRLDEAVNHSKLCLKILYHRLLNKDRVFFANVIRGQVESWLGRGIWPNQYDEWCSWMAGKPKGLKQSVISAALATTVYMSWRNMNNCIFKFSSFSVGFVINLIKYFVRGRLLSHTKKNIRKNDLAFFDKVVQM